MTQLSPLEEALFQSWARAHRVEDHNDPDNQFDYRGTYKETNGQIHPPGLINKMAADHNAMMNEQGEGGEAIDPAMAAVEHQKNLMEADHKAKDREHKERINTENNKVKILLKKMELEFKHKMAEQDRAHKAQEAEIARQHANAQAEADRVSQFQKSQIDHQHNMEATQVGHQHDMESAQVGQQHEQTNQLMAEQLERTRPQPDAKDPSSTVGGQLLRRSIS